jgi:hypothetical protein
MMTYNSFRSGVEWRIFPLPIVTPISGEAMPRKSPYLIDLTPHERAELERIAARYTSPYYLVVRAKIVLMAAAGLENKTIGERLSLPRQIVSKWRKRFYEKRLDGLTDEPRSGRPSSFSP